MSPYSVWVSRHYQIRPQNIERRCASNSWVARSISVRTDSANKAAGSLPVSFARFLMSDGCTGGRNLTCHLVGSGSGMSGKVGVIGKNGHSKYFFNQPHLIFPIIGKISALPIIANGMTGTLNRSSKSPKHIGVSVHLEGAPNPLRVNAQ